MNATRKAGRKPGTLVRAKCCICGTVELATGAGNFSRCSACKNSGIRAPNSRRSQYDFLGKEEAGSIVGAHIRSGLLESPKGKPCADCGGAAIEYEHRDYNKPLSVEPICRRCNLLRGPAIPLNGGLRKILDRGRVPYVFHWRVKKLLASVGISAEILDGMPKRLGLQHWEQIMRVWPDSSTPQAA